MNKQSIMEFFKPSLKKVLLSIALPIVYFAIFSASAQYIGSISNTPIGLILGTVFGTVFFIGTMPFSLNAAVFRTMGVDFLYSTGIIAKIGLMTGILLTIIWWYVLSCIILSVHNKINKKSNKI